MEEEKKREKYVTTKKCGVVKLVKEVVICKEDDMRFLIKRE